MTKVQTTTLGRSVWLSLLAVSALSAAGCFSRVHMSPSFGRANRQAFSRQVANPTPSAKIPKGLDALEATIVVDTYRAQLAPKAGGEGRDQGMILLSPNAGSLGYVGAPQAPPAAPAK